MVARGKPRKPFLAFFPSRLRACPFNMPPSLAAACVPRRTHPPRDYTFRAHQGLVAREVGAVGAERLRRVGRGARPSASAAAAALHRIAAPRLPCDNRPLAQ